MEFLNYYIDESYTPSDSDLIALFRVEASKSVPFREAVAKVASESSNGTWTELTTMKPYIIKLCAKAFYIKKPWVKIAYPLELFEEGNMSQILSSIAGNIFGMKAVRKLRLEDVYWPIEIIKWFKGPKYGINGVRDILKVYDRPILASVPKPKVGLTTDEFTEVAYEIWKGGVDLVKDDENLTSLSFNRFEERVKKMLRLRDKVENETGERKGYLVNISAPYREMIKRAKLVSELGGEFVMVDILTVGWSALQSLRDELEDLGLAIHAHRAFHAAFTRDPRHGMSMKVVAEISRIIGVDHIHVGTVVGKLEAKRVEVETLIRICREDGSSENMKLKFLKKNWNGLKPILPVSSGGLHPGLIPDIIRLFGKDLIIQVGGGVAGHPDGLYAGAKAFRDSVEATLEGIPLEDKARESIELKHALEHWGYLHPI